MDRRCVWLMLPMLVGCASPRVFVTDAELSLAMGELIGPAAMTWEAPPGSEWSMDGQWRLRRSPTEPEYRFQHKDGRTVPVPLPTDGAGKVALERRANVHFSRVGGWLWWSRGTAAGERSGLMRFDEAGAFRPIFEAPQRWLPVGEWSAQRLLVVEIPRSECVMNRLCATPSFRARVARDRGGARPLQVVHIDEAGVRVQPLEGVDGTAFVLAGTDRLWTRESVAIYRVETPSVGPARAVPVQVLTEAREALQCIAGSPTGRFVYGCSSRTAGASCYCSGEKWVWRWNGSRYDDLGVVGPGPSVTFDEARSLMATANADDYTVWDLSGDSPVPMVELAAVLANDYPVSIRLRDDALVVSGGRRSRPGARRFALEPPASVAVRVGGTDLRLATAPARDPSPWPALSVHHRWETGRGDAPSELQVTIINTGGPAYRVTATLASEPTAIEELPPVIHFGALAHGEAVTRTVRFARPPAFDQTVFRLTLTVNEQRGAAPPPRRWLTLPDWLGDEPAYHAAAKRIVDAGLTILRDRSDEPLEPSLYPMANDGYGFSYTAGFGGSVSYQNPFVMNRRAQRVNRQVSLTASAGEMHRHALMFLLWFLPHELIHALDGRAGTWPTERRANLAQPHLTEAILAALGDLPFTAETMRWVYDDYETRLREYVTPEERARIDAYLTSSDAPAPFSRGALDMFLNDTTRYVYWIARANQFSLSSGGSLDRWLQ